MKISVGWLKELTPVDATPQELAARLTRVGLEVEGIEGRGAELDGVVVGEVLDRRPHPRAERLTLVSVSDGAQRLEVVCGAPNVPAPGGRVALARVGARLPSGMEIARRDVRGAPSEGMLCSEVELGIGDDAGGILLLAPEDRPGSALADALGLRDTILEVNVTTNRPDCLGHLGVARELAAAFGAPLHEPPSGLDGLVDEALDVADVARVTLEDAEGCPRYTARVIDGLRVGPSPRWMQARLRAVGVRPISNLVDVTNYVLFELGQPLHAFDWARLRPSGTVAVRRAREAERIVTLDGVERTLSAEDVLICDGEGPVAVAGVMGGQGSEIDAGTRRVLLESAYFDPRRVRRTARRLGLHSEASHRFERGVDPSGAERAGARAARLLAEVAGGRVARGLIDVYPQRIEPARVAVRRERAERLLGLELSLSEIARLLGGIGLECEARGEIVKTRVPTFRPDLVSEVDLIEEVARLTGYERIPATLPRTASAPAPSRDGVAETARDVLVALGLDETQSYGFTAPERIAALGFAADEPRARPLRLRNPLREELSVLRTSLAPGLLGALRHNLDRGVADVRIFEVGTVFLERGARPAGEPARADAGLPDERRHVAALLSGARAGWLSPGPPLDFFDAKGLVDRLCERLRVEAPELSPCAPGRWPLLHPGVSAEVRAGGALLGAVGELAPGLRARLGLAAPCFYLELDLEAIAPPQPVRARELPRFPAVVRDVSFFIDEAVAAGEVARMLTHPLLERVAVVEDYREPGRVPAGKKGLLWSLTYRAADRTLTDDEVGAAHAELLARLGAAFRVELR